jgi:hypothetical protein
MEGNFIDGKPVSLEEAEAYRAEHFGGACQAVNQPWHSHGPVLQVGGMAYFNGNANDPNDKCGNDPLSMKLKSMRPDGTCPADGAMSYILIPDDGVADGG